jgi:hypothetical protein
MHCGESRNGKAVQRGMKYLDGTQFGVTYSTYEIGLQLCMLEKYFEPEILASGMYVADSFVKREEARKKLREAMPQRYANLVDNSWKRLDEAWLGDGYGYGGGAAPLNTPDNSNSQFAMLGMRAAVALGADVPLKIFVREAKRLFNTFGTSDAWDPMPMVRPWKPTSQSETDARTLIRPGGWGYYGFYKGDPKFKAVPHGCTGGGLCSLAIAVDELALRGELKEEDELAADKCLSGALAALTLCEVRLYGIANERIALDRDRAPKGKKEKERKEEKPPTDFDGMFVADLVKRSNKGGGRGMFYDLWALERGFVICGAKVVADYDWYKIVAEYLLSCQMQDGGWRAKNYTGLYGGINNQFIDTSWAALILKRVGPPVWAPSRRGPNMPPRPGTPARAETGEPDPKAKEGPTTPGK